MACFPQSLATKNEKICSEDGEICATVENVINSDESGRNAAQRIEQVHEHKLVFLV
jgi:hypothetical protein